MADPDTTTEPIAPHTDRLLGFAENLVYALAGALLVGASVAVLVAESFHYVTDLTEGVMSATTSLLDGLLLVFILLELLAGVRATMIEKRLVAEPFLVVGIIASIKEIIVTALEAQADEQGQRAFENSMIEVGVLGGLVVLLALASFLVRRKEREPTE
ncbi:MAG: phosphate-starvation-inducible PsiE family protein [Actinomycetota bacterium]|nr:phosphate-starvation-inducible PsiE family protein [Actinomycetota bacterium]